MSQRAAVEDRGDEDEKPEGMAYVVCGVRFRGVECPDLVWRPPKGETERRRSYAREGRHDALKTKINVECGVV